MFAHARKVAHRLDQPAPGMTRVRAGESDSLDAGNRIHLGKQLGEVAGWVVWSRIVIHDLPEQLHLSPPRCDCLPHVREDVGFGPHPLVSAGVRLSLIHISEPTRQAEISYA